MTEVALRADGRAVRGYGVEIHGDHGFLGLLASRGFNGPFMVPEACGTCFFFFSDY